MVCHLWNWSMESSRSLFTLEPTDNSFRFLRFIRQCFWLLARIEGTSFTLNQKFPDTPYYQWLNRQSKTLKVVPVQRVVSGDCRRFAMNPIGGNAAECHQSSLRCPMTNLWLPAFGPPRSLKTGVGSGIQPFPTTKILRNHKVATSRWAHLFKTTGFYLNYFALPVLLLLLFANHLCWTSRENFRAKNQPFKWSQTTQPKNCDHAHKTGMHWEISQADEIDSLEFLSSIFWNSRHKWICDTWKNSPITHWLIHHGRQRVHLGW